MSLLPNAFEWFIFGLALLLIVVLMNMFPICHWIAKKTIGETPKKDAGEAPSTLDNAKQDENHA